jgi:hypothetical protein
MGIELESRLASRGISSIQPIRADAPAAATIAPAVRIPIAKDGDGETFGKDLSVETSDAVLSFGFREVPKLFPSSAAM